LAASPSRICVNLKCCHIFIAAHLRSSEACRELLSLWCFCRFLKVYCNRHWTELDQSGRECTLEYTNQQQLSYTFAQRTLFTPYTTPHPVCTKFRRTKVPHAQNFWSDGHAGRRFSATLCLDRKTSTSSKVLEPLL
jgi:hypothetical protein